MAPLLCHYYDNIIIPIYSLTLLNNSIPLYSMRLYIDIATSKSLAQPFLKYYFFVYIIWSPYCTCDCRVWNYYSFFKKYLPSLESHKLDLSMEVLNLIWLWVLYNPRNLIFSLTQFWISVWSNQFTFFR